MVEKAKIFVRDAGKVIMVISLLLWFLSSYGPSDRMEKLSAKYEVLQQQSGANKDEIDREYRSEKLANSYAGLLGRAIEPAITPLGYDWKIGISLITSIAAREVFVGTMATLYSVEADDEDASLREKMNAAVRPDGSKVYTMATGISLMVFYVLAMQCMSTLAVVRRETRTWKWAIIQLLYMTFLAYVLAWVAYNLAS
jgi:ferrous iron transport protein B